MSSVMSRNRRLASASTMMIVLALVVIARPGSAQDAADTPSLANPALTIGASYSGDYRRNTTGGLETGNAYSQMLKLGADWHNDTLFDEASFTVSASVLYLSGDDISGTYVGDLQGLNNIEADTGWVLNEIWTEFAFGGSQTTVRAGVLDLNADFDAAETTGLFVGPPHGIGTDFAQTGNAGPSIFPLTGLGVRAAGGWDNGLAWRFGIYDGAPGGPDGDDFSHIHVSSEEGALTVGELAYSSDRVNKISLGAWSYSAEFERIDASMVPDSESESGNRGFYALIDVPLGSVGDAQLDGALRMGTANADFNPVDRYVGAAITLGNFLPNRPDDAFGIAIACARLGDPWRAAQAFAGADTTSTEISYELAYSAGLTDWLAIKPGVQFVQNPGADPSLDDAWVVGLRFEIVQEHSWQLSARHGKKADESYARSKP
jgi:porin